MAKITNIRDKPEIKKYFCGSQRLAHEIRTQLNQVPVEIFEHNNGKLINVFIMNPILSNFLKEWSDNNPKKKKAKE